MTEIFKTLALKVTPIKDKPENLSFILKIPALILASMKLIPVRYPNTRDLHPPKGLPSGDT